MIKTKDLTKIYTTEEVETTALNNINLEVREGEYKGLLVSLSTPNIEEGLEYGIKDANQGLKVISMLKEVGWEPKPVIMDPTTIEKNN